MKIKPFAAVVIAALGFLAPLDASAVPISGLYNTGAGSVSGGIDPNYTFVKTGGDGPAAGPAAYEGTNLAGSWLANSPTSQWLTPLSNGGQSFDASSSGLYTYSLTFDLTGFDASTAFFSGRWATDNTGIMTLNGGILFNPSANFSTWSTFSSAGGFGGFNSGLNTLAFTVNNFAQASGNPTGLRVEFNTSSVDVLSPVAAPVPEPGTIILMGSGLVGLFFFRGKIRKNV